MFTQKNLAISRFCFFWACVYVFPAYWDTKKKCFLPDTSPLRIRAYLAQIVIFVSVIVFPSLVVIEHFFMNPIPNSVKFFDFSIFVALLCSALCADVVRTRTNFILSVNRYLPDIDSDLRDRFRAINLGESESFCSYANDVIIATVIGLFSVISLVLNFIMENQWDPCYRYGYYPCIYMLGEFFENAGISISFVKFIFGFSYLTMLGTYFWNFAIVCGINFSILCFQEFWLMEILKNPQIPVYEETLRLLHCLQNISVNIFRKIYALMYITLLTCGFILIACLFIFWNSKDFEFPEIVLFPMMILYGFNFNRIIWQKCVSIVELSVKIKDEHNNALLWDSTRQRFMKSIPDFKCYIGNYFFIDRAFGITTLTFLFDQAISIILGFKDSE